MIYICEEYEDAEGNSNYQLPTARELVLDAIARKALSSDAISETKKDGYYLVKGSDRAGKPDHFYFNNDSYKRPAGELGNKWFWSSSSVPPYYSTDAYIFAGTTGYVGSHGRLLPLLRELCRALDAVSLTRE